MTRHLTRLLFLTALVMAAPAAPAYADFLGTVENDGCIVYQASTGQQVFFCDTDIRPTGTGYFNPFLRVNRDGTGGNPQDDTSQTYSSGWNTDANQHQIDEAAYNDFDASWSSALPLSSVSQVNTPPTGDWDPAVAGSSYSLFTVDINQISSGDGRFLTLNQMILYNCDTNAYVNLDAPTCESFFNLFGDSQDFINFNYRNHTGSGSGDIDVYIQNNGQYEFEGPYIALLDGWGCDDGSSIQPEYPCDLHDAIAPDNDGFQEWATTVAPGGQIPEPASLLLLGSGLSAAAAARRRNRKANK